jgi:ribosomal protein S18 acetylase RimI-like enzyme
LILAAVEKKAREIGCCKITLEVQENNRRAQGIYQAAGFSQAVHVEAAGGALFLSKSLKNS